jgi:cation:H+ antiporter
LSILLQVLLVTAGFFLLYFGANLLVRGATAVALNLNVSKVVIGITLVAFGTSSPELFVNLNAAYRGNTGLALSNVAGSNLTNLCIGFGLCALVGRLVIARDKFRIDLTYFAITPLFVLFFFFVYPGKQLPFWTFVPFTGFFIAYLMTAKRRLRSGETNDLQKTGLVVGIGIFLLGCVTLYAGGELVRRSAVEIAEMLHVPESVIGLTIVAVGTSIPDVMASLVAMRRRETSIAVGNLLGSNIFNVLLVLGGTTLVSMQNIEADLGIMMDYVLAGAAAVLFVIMVTLSPRFGPYKGLFFLLIYPAYMVIRLLIL